MDIPIDATLRSLCIDALMFASPPFSFLFSLPLYPPIAFSQYT